jgi:hypothetical protein
MRWGGEPAARRGKVEPLEWFGGHHTEECTMNVQGKIEGDKLVLTIDLSKAAREAAKPSSTGKSKLIATTSGFTGFGDVKVSLNATIA